MYCILFFDLWRSADQTRGRVTLNATYRAVAKKWWMKTRRSSAAAVLEFTARERESKDGKGKRENEDAAERNVEEKRDNRVKWRRENGRERERIWDEGKEGGATIKPNRLELFDPHPTAHKHTHTHIHILSLPASGSHGACTFAGRQAGDQSCSGTSVYVCKRRVSNMLVAACAVLVKVQC